MNIQKYLEKIKDFQRNLLNYLDDEVEEQEYHNMIKYLIEFECLFSYLHLIFEQDDSQENHHPY